MKINFANFLRIISFLIVTNVSHDIHAQYLTGPVASAFGGAGRAGVEDGEQFFLNPAAVVHSSKAASALIFIDGYNGKFEHDRAIGLSINDNADDLLFSGAYGFVTRKRTWDGLPNLEENHHTFTLARRVSSHLAVGVSATYTKSEIEPGPEANALYAADPETDASGEYSQINGNIGFHYNPVPDYGLGLVFYNVGPTDEKIPDYVQHRDKIGLGFHGIFLEFFRVRADLSQQLGANPDKKKELNLGIESKLSGLFLFRGGYQRDELGDRTYYTLGLGFDGPRLKVDYFYRQNVDYSDGALHGVDMRLPFW